MNFFSMRCEAGISIDSKRKIEFTIDFMLQAQQKHSV